VSIGYLREREEPKERVRHLANLWKSIVSAGVCPNTTKKNAFVQAEVPVRKEPQDIEGWIWLTHVLSVAQEGLDLVAAQQGTD